jgi:hypothetical protein
MKWLTLTLIKQQLRLEQDYHDEDALLELYGGSAENTILQCTNRTVDELKAMNPAGTDTIPEEIMEALLMLVTVSYRYRTPIDMQNLSIVPYTFDLKIKNYVRLADRKEVTA